MDAFNRSLVSLTPVSLAFRQVFVVGDGEDEGGNDVYRAALGGEGSFHLPQQLCAGYNCTVISSGAGHHGSEPSSFLLGSSNGEDVGGGDGCAMAAVPSPTTPTPTAKGAASARHSLGKRITSELLAQLNVEDPAPGGVKFAIEAIGFIGERRVFVEQVVDPEPQPGSVQCSVVVDRVV